MTTAPFIAPGPFDRLVGIHLGKIRHFCFRLRRDDGLLYAPGLEASVTLSLYSESAQWIFSGQSHTLSYSEGGEGVVVRFDYDAEYYQLTLHSDRLKACFGLDIHSLRCLLHTQGTDTLATVYNRITDTEGTPTPMAPGSYDLTLPFWRITPTQTHPTLRRTDKAITVQSSVPFRAELDLLEARPLGLFHLPLLGVLWKPTPDLLGWTGQIDVWDVCAEGSLFIPWQYPDALYQPATLPTTLWDRQYVLEEDVILKIALSACPGRWQALSVVVTSDFGFSQALPYQWPGSGSVTLHHPLSDFAPSLAGKTFRLQAETDWDGSQFTYSTGESPIHTGLTAALVESPALDFETFTFQPLPE